MGSPRASVGGRTVAVASALSVALVAAACTSGGGSSVTTPSTLTPGPPSPSNVVGATSTITIAQFNSDISDEYPTVDLSKVAEAIRVSGAQVAGIEEGGGEVAQVAKDLGWGYFDIRMQVVSSLPLIDPPDAGGAYTFAQLSPGRVVAIENVHLPSDPYGPYWIRDGKALDTVLALETRLRLPAVQPQLQAAQGLVAQGIPVFLMGDFNSPSFHDWTAATADTRKYLPYAVSWPVTSAVEAAGFRDSYRVVHPDPVTDPGLTWPVHRDLPGWNPTAKDPLDRIDFIFSTGAATATASSIIGEPGGPQVATAVVPWPSDHRLVASTFTVTPGMPPTLVTAAQRLFTVGDPVKVTWHAPAGSGQQVGIAPIGELAAQPIARQTIDAADGSVTFASSSRSPGGYDAVLLDASGAQLSRYPFWVQASGAKPTIQVSTAYVVGEPILAMIRSAPGYRWDWVGVYHRGADPNVASYLLWAYTHSAIDGSVTLDGSANGKWPLPPGEYSLYLLKDDLYVELAGTTFYVTPPP